jgi:DNA-3-methyladenine glycosylase II
MTPLARKPGRTTMRGHSRSVANAAETASPKRQPARRVFELRPRPPFRLDLTVWAQQRRKQNRIDTWDGQSYRRALALSGVVCEVSVTQVGSEDQPHLEVVLSGARAGSAEEAAARDALSRLLGLHLDLSDFYERAARDNVLNGLVQRYRGVKPPRFPTIFECLLNAVACQQLSLAAGLTLLSRLSATAGASAGALHTFPAPVDVLTLSRSTLQKLGFSRRKAETILQLADAATAGELELAKLDKLDDAAIVEALIQRPGVGPWSADYVLLRGLGRLHVFPRRDSGALNGLRGFLVGTEYEGDPEAALRHWAPDAGVVYFHLLLRGLEQRGTRFARSTSSRIGESTLSAS